MTQAQAYDGATEPSTRALKAFNSRGLSDDQLRQVNQIKFAAAKLWDLIDAVGTAVPPGDNAGRLVALAKTELEATVLWTVKAVSRTSE